MPGLAKQMSEWIRRVEEVLLKRNSLSVELAKGGGVLELVHWGTIEAFVGSRESAGDAVKLAALDRLAREPQRDTDDNPETRAARLTEQQEMVLQAANQLVGTALELSAMISALEKDFPSPPGPKKRAKVRRKRIARQIAELDALCKRQRTDMRIIDGLKAA